MSSGQPYEISIAHYPQNRRVPYLKGDPARWKYTVHVKDGWDHHGWASFRWSARWAGLRRARQLGKRLDPASPVVEVIPLDGGGS